MCYTLIIFFIGVNMKITSKTIQFLRFIVQAFFLFGTALSLKTGVGLWGTFLLLPIFIFGVFFCGWVCPFGSMQEWIGKMGRKLGIKKYKIPRYIQDYLQMSRYVFLALYAVGVTVAVLNARGTFGREFFSGTADAAALIVMGGFLAASFFMDRPFCNYFCGKGASYGLFGIFRLFSIQRDAGRCVHCRLCNQKCPMNIMVEYTDFVRHPNCINCFQCINVCPVKCLHFRLNKRKGEKE